MKRLNRSRILLSFLFIVLSASAGRLTLAHQENRPGQEQESVRLNATLVQVPAVVTDRSGKFVANLTQSEFSLYEDGKSQEVALFTDVKQPFNAVLILDTSNSAEDRLAAIRNTAAGFVKAIGPTDQLSIMTFDHEVRQLTEFTNDRNELEGAIKGTEVGFGKLLYEAVARGLDQLKEKEGRRALIIFSDGIDMGSVDASAEKTIQQAEAVGAAIYVVRFDTRWWVEAELRRNQSESARSNLPFDIDMRIPLPPEFGGQDTGSKKSGPKIVFGPQASPPVTVTDGTGGMSRSTNREPRDKIAENLDRVYGEAFGYLEKLTSHTGGLVFIAERLDDTRAAFAQIADELHNQYLVGFYPKNERRDGKYRKIKLEVKRKDVQVRARPGYRAVKE